ncbi:MAG: 2-C-methyl-D-erythritol 4-phosphate cytidylyltransferase [Opitutales bacterium]
MSDAGDILVLLAAGSARRMQSVVDDKTLAPLCGTPVFIHALRAFVRSGKIGRAILTYRDDAQLIRIRHLLEDEPADLPITFVRGGDSRQESVLAALSTCETHTGFVHIHDAARPLVTPAAIEKVRDRALETGAAILAGRSSDTVKIARADSSAVAASPDRSLVWTAETPQVFRTADILRAYRKVNEAGRKVTDDSSALESIGVEVALVENPDVNLKITRPSDFALAEAVLRSRGQ